jgi:hypothetical protein
MKVKIHARFATAEDTARVFGVPLSRARKLAKLVDSYRFKQTELSNSKSTRSAQRDSFSTKTSTVSKNGSRARTSAGQLKRKTATKAHASGKSQTRAKVSKASR